LLLIYGNEFAGSTPVILLGIGMYGTGYFAIKTARKTNILTFQAISMHDFQIFSFFFC